MQNTGKDEEEWAYVGEWAVEEPTVWKGMEGDKGLVVKNQAAHHAISAKFPKKIDPKGKTLVVQYEVKLQSTFIADFPAIAQPYTDLLAPQRVSSVVELT